MKALNWVGFGSATSRILIGLFALLISCKATDKTSRTGSGPVLLTIGDTKVPVAEFKYIYDKNNANEADAYTEKSIKEYLDLFVSFKLKVHEAGKLGMDTTQEFKDEFAEYRKTLARPYFVDTTLTNQLIKEAYDRLKEEIRASHILIKVDAMAEPQDTLAAYNKIKDIRKRAVNGEDFGELAYFYSEDPSAKGKPGDLGHRGDLGYFTALQMIYPFEDAAYKTPVGQISQVVRTQYGYHIIKVVQRRPSNGSVKVAHIMIRATEGISREDSMAAYNKIMEIDNRLKSGGDWNQMVEQFSDDLGSKDKKGELEWFTSGNMIPAFEEAAFGLRKPGDLSSPVHTPYGWHIIKLIEKKPLESFDDLETILRQKVSKDSRSELNRTSLLRRLRRENNLVENPKVTALFVAKSDSSLLKGEWKYKRDDKDLGKVLFSIHKQKYTLKDFFNHIEKEQLPQQGLSPSHYMSLMYQNYVEKTLLAYEEDHLAEKHPPYGYLVNEYRDGILLFKIMEQNVWTKAVSDSEGLEKYFAQFKDKYRWPERVNATVYSITNEQALAKLKEELKKEYLVNEDVKFGDTNFDFNSTDLTQQEEGMLHRIADYMRKDTNSIVELRAYSLKGEKGDILVKRVNKIKDHLTSEGIAAGRIADAKIAPPASATGAILNPTIRSSSGGAVQYLVYTRSKKVLESKFNKANPLTLQITEGVFQKGDNKFVDEVEWKPGAYTLQKDNRLYYVIINKVEPARYKTLNETRGTVVSDYQAYLEQEWVSALRKKYGVQINEVEVKKMIKK